MILFHLSHTDLDGYGCHMVSKKIYNNGFYFNANYGQEVKQNIKTILSKIENHKDDKIFVLITDLNLSIDESKNLEKKINYLKKDGYDIELQLLDHHKSGQISADKYDWYFLDDTRCATKITYDYFKNLHPEKFCDSDFELLIDSIDAVDLWHENSEHFEFGKVLLRLIAKAHEVNNTLFKDNNREFKLFLLEKSLSYLNKGENNHILLDDDVHLLKKEFLNINENNDTIDNLSAQYLLSMILKMKDKLTIIYNGHKGLLTYSLGNISIPANKFLKENKDYDFFLDIGRRGTISLRADNNLDVSILAKKLANGGGHPNASGGAFEHWKDIPNYDDLHKFIQDKLDNI